MAEKGAKLGFAPFVGVPAAKSAPRKPSVKTLRLKGLT
jgi:hypothetical protein